MSKRFAIPVLAAMLLVLGLAWAADTPAKQPVLVFLYSRIYDHINPQYADERIQRLLPLLERYRAKYPESGISTVLQFSGTMAQVMAERSTNNHLVERLKDYQNRGVIELGYTGEDEPTYYHRPRPDLLLADTPEKRWLANGEAAEKFLTDYKNPVTGEPFPGLTGGLKRTQEVFGPAAYVSAITQTLGGDAAALHQLRRLNDNALLLGLPDPDQTRGIEGYARTVDGFSRVMSPAPNTSPEIFWQNNFLRSSEKSLQDLSSLSMDAGPDALKKTFEKLDRSRVRVVHMEIGGYLRFLIKRSDGSVKWHPLEWAYTRQDEPRIPANIEVFTDRGELDKAYAREEQALRWLEEDFFPSNPGSRFVSVANLKKIASNPVGTEIAGDRLREAAQDLLSRFTEVPGAVPAFARAGDAYFSLADMFQLLSEALGEQNRAGDQPSSVKLVNAYGPLAIDGQRGPAKVETTVDAVRQAAASVAARWKSQDWKPLPENSVPITVELNGVKVTAAQFLNLMAQAYVDPVPGKALSTRMINSIPATGILYPRNTDGQDQGSIWTFRPAALRLSF